MQCREENTRAAQGRGNIRKKTVTRGEKNIPSGRRVSLLDAIPVQAKQIRRSFSGKTPQKEVREKMQSVAVAINDGTILSRQNDCRTMARHMGGRYLNSVKPRTVESYKANIKQHIKPAVGALRLSELTAVDVQRLYNNPDQ